MDSQHTVRPKPAAALVIGGGIGGMRAVLDLADAGLKAYLVEETPCLGGRVAQLGYMFPQHDCVLCRGTADHGFGCTRPSLSPAYVQHNLHPNIDILTNTRVIGLEGQAGDFTVTLRHEPRHVDPAKCIDCGRCAEVCPVERPDDYQRGMAVRKAAYKVAARAAPNAYVIERGPYCEGCGKCAEVCPTKAIDLEEAPHSFNVHVGALILALGFSIYDAREMEELGLGRYANVIDAMQYERLASRSGPTEGVVTRPSDGQRPRSIAWLQCIGSRDQNNPFCSSICCMYATKEALLAKQRLGGDVDCSIFIMDERAFNKEYSTYFAEAKQKQAIQYHRCRVSDIREDPVSGDLFLSFTDSEGRLRREPYQMVVLATGLQPPLSAELLADTLEIDLNEYGFCQTDKFTPLQTTRPGVFVCGSFSSPKEISETIIDASGAAAEVMRLLNERLNSYQTSREWPFLSAGPLPPERDVGGEDPRVGLILCTCGKSISQDIDLPELANKASGWPGVAACKLVDYACFPGTLDHIKEIITDLGLNRVVIAACSNRTHEPLFQRIVRESGLNPYLMELINLRDQCSRVHVGQRGLASRKAAEMVRIGVGRVSAAQAVHKQRHRRQQAALVIGGGVAGMTAALAIADSGYQVHLVERTDTLGGNLRNLYYVAEGYNPRRLLRDLVNRVRAHQLIATYVRSEITAHAGHVGDFRATISARYSDGAMQQIPIQHGTVIVATGAQEHRDHHWLSLPQVMTQQELEEKILHHPKEIAALNHVVMIQCVAANGTKFYCSRVCCTNTMKNATRLKLFNPGCQVTVLYKDIVTYGFREAFYTEARQLGVRFVRYTDEQPPEILVEPDGVKVKVLDLVLKRPLLLPADAIPLSMTVAPPKGTTELAKQLRVPLASEGFFSEAQLKLRPMDFARDGIFLAGMAHYPKFIEESISHALAAAGRALSLLSQESMYLGGVVATVDPDKCVGCLTCTRVCPFDIPQVVERPGRNGVGGLGGAAYIDPSQCHGCGTCTGDCPADAIELTHYRAEQMFLREIGGLGRWTG